MTKRLWSVDAFRGLTMINTIVAYPLIPAFASLSPGTTRDFVLNQLNHAPWNGFTRTDFIFPGFVMLLGLSVVLSLKKYVHSGTGYRQAYVRMAKRAVVLFLLGFI